MMIVWKHIDCKPYSDKDVGSIGKIRIFSMHYEHGITRGESGHYVLVPLLPGFKEKEYACKDIEEGKHLASELLESWLKATGLQENDS